MQTDPILMARAGLSTAAAALILASGRISEPESVLHEGEEIANRMLDALHGADLCPCKIPTSQFALGLIALADLYLQHLTMVTEVTCANAN